MKFQTSIRPLSAFSHSSLTDIVMLLLIYFLLTSQFVVHSGVKVKLPGSQTKEQTQPSKLIVTITDAGGVYVGEDEVGIAGLAGRLSQLQKEAAEKNLIIRADRTVPIELVIKVIDAAKGVGLDKFTLETEKENQQ